MRTSAFFMPLLKRTTEADVPPRPLLQWYAKNSPIFCISALKGGPLSKDKRDYTATSSEMNDDDVKAILCRNTCFTNKKMSLQILRKISKFRKDTSKWTKAPPQIKSFALRKPIPKPIIIGFSKAKKWARTICSSLTKELLENKLVNTHALLKTVTDLRKSEPISTFNVSTNTFELLRTYP